MEEILEFLLGLLIILIGLYVYFNYFSTFSKYKRWFLQHAEIHNYDDATIHKFLKDLGGYFTYSDSAIPFGRSKWFVTSSKTFNSGIKEIDGLEFYGYSPIRSATEEKMIEYGMLLTQSGIFIKNESDNIDIYLPFSGLWKVECQEERILFYYPYSIKKISRNISKIDWQSLASILNRLIDTGYTTDLKMIEVSDKNLSKQFLKEWKVSNFSRNILTSSLSSINTSLLKHLHLKQFNSIASGRMGHGHAAEYANDLIDKIKNPFKDVRQIGQDNAKNGADRLVGTQKIQTKYYANARNSVNAAFDSKADGGMYRYKGMQLEVPKDQYAESVNIMRQKIIDGKVEGVHDPNQAKNIVRKGNVTYQDAKLIAKGGNLVAIKYDALDGAIQSLPGAGIGFAIVYAQAIWSGVKHETAVKYAVEAGVKTLVLGTLIYTSSQQIGKVLTGQLANVTGKKFIAENVARNAGTVITIGIVVVPDLFDSLTGRISTQQLLKNTIVAGSGIAGGAMVGSMFGGPVGAAIGGLAGAVAGSSLAQAVMDHFIKDDRVEMFAILKEEFIDVVMSITLTQEEFKKVQEQIFDDKLQDKLKDMYQHKNKNSRKYARENIVERVVEKVISSRRMISKDEVIEAVQTAENSFEAVV